MKFQTNGNFLSSNAWKDFDSKFYNNLRFPTGIDLIVYAFNNFQY